MERRNGYETRSGFAREVIRQTRARLGPAPRSCPPEVLRQRRLSPPRWMTDSGDSRFLELYDRQNTLFRRGIVVWACIVQANLQLFRPGPEDCPAALVYSLHPRMDDRIDLLSGLAKRLFRLKGQQTEPDLQPIADLLADEIAADWKVPVPTRLADGMRCFLMTTMIGRKHLPDRYLAQAQVPLLVCPDKTDVGMILPRRFWADQLVAAWQPPVN